MTRQYVFQIEPVAKGRPRITTIGGSVRSFTPLKTRTYEACLARLAKLQNEDNGWNILDEPLSVKALFFLKKPKSAKKRNYPTSRPDLDNFLKCLDSFNGIIWSDDSLICRIITSKEYSTSDGFIILEVETIQ